MKSSVLFLYLFFMVIFAYAQQRQINGFVTDSLTQVPLSGITVMIIPGGMADQTNENGYFKLKNSSAVKFIRVSGVGYRTKTIQLNPGGGLLHIKLSGQQIQLTDVVISANNGNPYKIISEADLKMRAISNSQEALRLVPGLFIGQHQGGGKAEQIFLRGFDNDHGTDINLSVDGMPINMVSQAHGQGYADSHFIIPETIEDITYKKGMYDADKGDLAVTGYVAYHTLNSLKNNVVRVEAGQFNTFRALAMVNLLGYKARSKQQSWYAASEYRYSNSYFDNPQHFKRFNFFTKYDGRLSQNNTLTASASTFYSSWSASGQIPQSAVDNGTVGFFGALDPNEGGVTSRSNINTELLTTLNDHSLIKNQLYYSRYKFDLHTNFTFFLVDTVNGDEIRQKESRNHYGYNGSFMHEGYLGGKKLSSNFGIYARLDATNNSELSHTVNRYTLLNRIKLGDITELSSGAYLNETLQLNQQLSLNAGLRFDQFSYQYNNKLATDSTLNGTGFYTAKNSIFSPKVNLYYQPGAKTQFYLSAGKGFNSNDTRVVVAAKGLQTLPAAYGTDLGTVLKPLKNLIVNAALWYSYLQKEYVYGGDGGTVDFSGRTQRAGFDFSGRYQPIAKLYFDVDVNYAHGRALDDPKGDNYIPLAPVWSSTGGATYFLKNGFNGSLRYRYLGDRPANQDYTLTAVGYFVNDLVLNYTKPKYEVGLIINNLFNVKWKETQFETVTRLKNEAVATDGIAFTAGTKFAAVTHISYFFK